MSNDKMGGPAFPHDARTWTEGREGLQWEHTQAPHDGMTLWDYYAAAAVSSLVGVPLNSPGSGKRAGANIAFIAGEIADAMLAERAKRQENMNE